MHLYEFNNTSKMDVAPKAISGIVMDGRYLSRVRYRAPYGVLIIANVLLVVRKV